MARNRLFLPSVVTAIVISACGSSFAWDMRTEVLANGTRVTSLSETISKAPEPVGLIFLCRGREKRTEFTAIVASSGDRGHGLVQGVSKHGEKITIFTAGKSSATYKLKSEVMDSGNDGDSYAIKATDDETEIVHQIVSDLSFTAKGVGIAASGSVWLADTDRSAFSRFLATCSAGL